MATKTKSSSFSDDLSLLTSEDDNNGPASYGATREGSPPPHPPPGQQLPGHAKAERYVTVMLYRFQYLSMNYTASGMFQDHSCRVELDR